MIEAGALFPFLPSRGQALFSNPHASNSGLWRSVTGRGSHPTGSVTGCAARHEARHSPRLRLAPACSSPRPRPGVAELGVVRRLAMRTFLHVAAGAFLCLIAGVGINAFWMITHPYG